MDGSRRYGEWSDGANWAPAGPPPNPVPSADDVVVVAPLAARLTSNVDVPWTVESLRFNERFPSGMVLPTFALTGSPLTVNRSLVSAGRADVEIGNDLVLAGTDGGRGREVVMSGGGVRR